MTYKSKSLKRRILRYAIDDGTGFFLAGLRQDAKNSPFANKPDMET
jgi:hypothetical protein